MSYGDERSEARRLRSILEEGDRMTQPRTQAGRELVEDEPRLVTGEHSMLRRVLAIEAEAATPTVDLLDHWCAWRRAHANLVEQSGLLTPASKEAGGLDVERLENVIRETRRFAERPGEWARHAADLYARLVPQPARPADTVCRHCGLDWSKPADPEPTSSEPYCQRVEHSNWPDHSHHAATITYQRARPIVIEAEQPTSSEQDQ